MVPKDITLPFFDTPLGFTLVIGAICVGFYLFVGKFKTPGDYHRQGVEIEKRSEKLQRQQQEQEQQQADKKEEEKPSIMSAPPTTLAPPKDTPITPALLATHDGSSADPDAPIWLAIKGTVFDVSAKRGMYGPGGGYSVFAGKDGSVGLGKSSLKPEDAVADYSTLEPAEMKVLDQWYEFFSKRYNVVGKVVKE